jgi:hypothetical protein
MAEVWRATSLVMVIVVSGLQAISDEVLEAAEVFGATLWQRVRYVILPAASQLAGRPDFAHDSGLAGLRCRRGAQRRRSGDGAGQ